MGLVAGGLLANGAVLSSAPEKMQEAAATVARSVSNKDAWSRLVKTGRILTTEEGSILDLRMQIADLERLSIEREGRKGINHRVHRGHRGKKEI